MRSNYRIEGGATPPLYGVGASARSNYRIEGIIQCGHLREHLRVRSNYRIEGIITLNSTTISSGICVATTELKVKFPLQYSLSYNVVA